ncbi:YsnF/AvaK domain-containing protein [Spirosoma aerophilum]
MNNETDSTLLPTPNTRQSDEAWTNQVHKIPVIEEQIQIDKNIVETGVVRISKRVHEDREVIDLPGSREEITVERVAINQFVETPPSVRYEGDTMIIPVLEEVVITQKKLLLVEEVHVIKRKVQENESQEVVLRKEEVVIERVPMSSTSPE